MKTGSKVALLALATALLVILGVGGVLLHEYRRDRVLTVAAGPRTSEAFEIMAAVSRVLSTHHPRLRLEVVETTSSDQNLELLAARKVQLATALADGAAPTNARLVASLYADSIQLLVHEDTRIETVADLAGHAVAVPATGRGGDEGFGFVAQHYELSKDDVQVLPMSARSANWSFTQGLVDAIFLVRAPGNPTIQALIEQAPSRLLPIDQAPAMRLKRPAIASGVIPKGSYRGDPPVPPTDLPTATMSQILVADADLSARLVNILTQILLEQRRELALLTPLAGQIQPPDDRGFLPIHEGTQRYLDREKPSFLREQAPIIGLSLSLLALLSSALVGLKARLDRGQRSRIDRYNQRLIQISQLTLEQPDPATRRLLGKQLADVLAQAIQDLDNDQVTRDGFDAFAFTWQAVHAMLQDRSAAGAVVDRTASEAPSGAEANP